MKGMLRGAESAAGGNEGDGKQQIELLPSQQLQRNREREEDERLRASKGASRFAGLRLLGEEGRVVAENRPGCSDDVLFLRGMDS